MAEGALRGRRRQIATLVSERGRTLYEIARAMGVPAGSIYRLIHRMVDDGVLEPDADPPTRGTLFRLNAAYLEALDDAVPEDGKTGLLSPGQRILITRARTRTKLHDVLSHPSVASCVAWVAELDGSGRLLIAMARDASFVQTDRLVAALEDARIVVSLGRVGDVLGGDEMRRAAPDIKHTPKELVR